MANFNTSPLHNLTSSRCKSENDICSSINCRHNSIQDLCWNVHCHRCDERLSQAPASPQPAVSDAVERQSNFVFFQFWCLADRNTPPNAGTKRS